MRRARLLWRVCACKRADGRDGEAGEGALSRVWMRGGRGGGEEEAGGAGRGGRSTPSESGGAQRAAALGALHGAEVPLRSQAAQARGAFFNPAAAALLCPGVLAWMGEGHTCPRLITTSLEVARAGLPVIGAAGNSEENKTTE